MISLHEQTLGCHTDINQARTTDGIHIEQGFKQVNQRLAQIGADLRANVRQMHNWLFRLDGTVVFGFIGSIVLTLIEHAVLPYTEPTNRARLGR